LVKSVNTLPVAVAEHHGLTVPESVVVASAEMHVAVQAHAAVIDRIALKDLLVQASRRAEAVEGPD
jgi:hypothetical protein